MKLYLISQNKNTGYDVYDSAIVCAENEEEARTIHPDQYKSEHTWTTPDNVTVKMIGEAGEHIEKGVVLASFNAG